MSSEKKERITDRFQRELDEILKDVCENICRYAREDLTQEELDERCESCPLCRL